MAEFGRRAPETPLPGLSAEDRAFRASFNLSEHLKSMQGQSAPPRPGQPSAAVPTINLDLMRENLRKEGFDFAIFPIGEKPKDLGGYAISREAKITELEEENAALRTRAVLAEETAAIAAREVGTLKSEIDALKSQTTEQENS